MGDFRFMSVPLVSVIMTVYNCEKYIEESLDSIFNQTFKDFEVIVYTDACTDKTQEIVGKYFDNYKNFNPLIYGRRDGPIGCFKGRMEAITRSKGKYIAIQDGDDISFKDRLEEEVNFLEKNNDIFCVGSWANKIDENGEDTGTKEYPLNCKNLTFLNIVVGSIIGLRNLLILFTTLS